MTGWPHKHFYLRDAWCLHGCLVAAAEEFNSLYSAQLLLWIAGLTFNIISRIYVFCQPGAFHHFAQILREGGVAIFMTFLLTILAGVCHMTATEVNSSVYLLGIVELFATDSRYM